LALLKWREERGGEGTEIDRMKMSLVKKSLIKKLRT
jgi:hypothetical protein